MKAFIVDRYGKKNGARIGEMPDPELRQDDVLVQIHAAGVNLLDPKIRNGEFKFLSPYRLPLILGNDVAGSRNSGRIASASIQARRLPTPEASLSMPHEWRGGWRWPRAAAE